MVDLMGGLQRVRTRAVAWPRADRNATVKIVVGLTLVALALRTVALGWRVAHFDEGRVAYWAWHFGETGSFAYRYIIHGPLIQHVDRWVFSVLGPTDFSMRLPVAIVGGLLPLSALLFRRHLDRLEVIALAVLFTLDPLLLYYSRFMRSDVLVAVFMFTAFGFLVRLYDTRNARHMYAAAAFLAFGFASKENAIVYVVTWLGATGLLLAKVFLLPSGFRNAVLFITDAPPIKDIIDRIIAGIKTDIGLIVGLVRSFRQRHSAAWQVVVIYLGHLMLALGVFVLVSLFFYAPRGAGLEGIKHPPASPSADSIGFWTGFQSPSMLAQLFEITADRAVDQWAEWLDPASENSVDDYVGHLGTFLKAFGYGSGSLAALAGFGYILDRLGYTPPRHLTPFLFYAGFVSIFGYPLGSDIAAPWIAVHAVVPLAVPAAVGLGAFLRWGSDEIAAEDAYGTISVLSVLFAITVLTAGALGTMVYTNTTAEENAFVQFAQPEEDLKHELSDMDRLAASNDGTDVFVYYGQSGDDFDNDNAYVGPNREDWNESRWNTQPTCMMWYNSLPLPWYFAAGDMDVRCLNDDTTLSDRVTENRPPILITQEFDPTVPEARLEASGYSSESYLMRTFGSKNRVTIWTRDTTNGTELNA
jgi:uncharacterized protein (TIGR03663 family)